MRSVRIALAAGLACLTLAIGLTLLGSPIGVAHSNKLAGNESAIWETSRGTTLCQAHESLPSGTTAIRMWLAAPAGPGVKVLVSSHGRVLTSGSRPSIWVGGSVTVPVRPLRRTVADVSVCASFDLRDETVVAQGSLGDARTATRANGQPLLGRIGIEFLRPQARSWASQALEVARRMGLGRALPGTWIALLALALLLAVVGLVSRSLLRELA